MENKYPLLLSPYKIGKLTIKNRFTMAPMGTQLSFGSHGEWSETGIEYYTRRAQGGFGLLYTGSLTTDMEVDPFSPHPPASPLYSPVNFTRTSIYMTERVHAYGAKMFAQITMGTGRNYGFAAPSELPAFINPAQTTKALTVEEIKKKVDAMVRAAALMKASGFDGVEVHSIHWGYLLDEFAMSLTNHRTDEYGGSLENRLRAAREIVEGIKQVCGADYPVSMRLGLKSYIKGLFQPSLDGSDEAGRTLEEGVRIAQLLEQYGYDVLNVDVGTYDSFCYAVPTEYTERGFMLPMAEAAKKAVNIPVICGGGRLDDADMLEKALAAGQIDAVALGRASLADPDFPKKVARGEVETIRPCILCNNGCFGRGMAGGDASCAVNPQAVREAWYGITKAMEPKNVLIVGGGVAGMEAARTAALRGHHVEVYEKAPVLGGNLISAGAPSFKEEVRRLNTWYQNELKALGIPVHTNCEMTAEKIKAAKPDAVILAVGSSSLMPKIPGIDHEKTVSCVDALLKKKTVGQKVVIVGGGLVGCETAIEYAMQGKEVTIVEALDSILAAGTSVPIMNSMMVNLQIAKYGIGIRTGCRIEAVTDDGAVIRTADGQQEVLPADSVIMSIGFRPLPSMAQELYGCGFDVYQVGDEKGVGNVKISVWDAYEVARSI